jgi:hypothetical protein
MGMSETGQRDERTAMPPGCPLRTLVAAYALGALDPGERDLMGTHLPGCPECGQVMDQVAGLPGLLARVSPQEAAAGPPVPDEAMLGRLCAAAALSVRRTRSRRLRAAAAVVAVVLVSGTAVGLGARGAEPGRTVSSAQGAVHASVRLTSASGGTVLRLTLSGVDPEQTCRLVAIADDGHREVAASWKATYSGTARIGGTAALPPHRISRLVIETFDERVLLTLPVAES